MPSQLFHILSSNCFSSSVLGDLGSRRIYSRGFLNSLQLRLSRFVSIKLLVHIHLCNCKIIDDLFTVLENCYSLNCSLQAAYFLPLVIIAYCYIHIIHVVASATKIQSSKEKNKTEVKLAAIVMGIVGLVSRNFLQERFSSLKFVSLKTHFVIVELDSFQIETTICF